MNYHPEDYIEVGSHGYGVAIAVLFGLLALFVVSLALSIPV